MDTICAYCARTADHLVEALTVCDSIDCELMAQRDQRKPTPLNELLARYAGGER